MASKRGRDDGASNRSYSSTAYSGDVDEIVDDFDIQTVYPKGMPQSPNHSIQKKGRGRPPKPRPEGGIPIDIGNSSKIQESFSSSTSRVQKITSTPDDDVIDEETPANSPILPTFNEDDIDSAPRRAPAPRRDPPSAKSSATVSNGGAEGGGRVGTEKKTPAHHGVKEFAKLMMRRLDADFWTDLFFPTPNSFPLDQFAGNKEGIERAAQIEKFAGGLFAKSDLAASTQFQNDLLNLFDYGVDKLKEVRESLNAKVGGEKPKSGLRELIELAKRSTKEGVVLTDAMTIKLYVGHAVIIYIMWTLFASIDATLLHDEKYGFFGNQINRFNGYVKRYIPRLHSSNYNKKMVVPSLLPFAAFYLPTEYAEEICDLLSVQKNTLAHRSSLEQLVIDYGAHVYPTRVVIITANNREQIEAQTKFDESVLSATLAFGSPTKAGVVEKLFSMALLHNNLKSFSQKPSSSDKHYARLETELINQLIVPEIVDAPKLPLVSCTKIFLPHLVNYLQEVMGAPINLNMGDEFGKSARGLHWFGGLYSPFFGTLHVNEIANAEDEIFNKTSADALPVMIAGSIAFDPMVFLEKSSPH